MCKGNEWKSLSIPRGKTAEFNAKKFAQPKNETHYAQEFLDGTHFKEK